MAEHKLTAVLMPETDGAAFPTQLKPEAKGVASQATFKPEANEVASYTMLKIKAEGWPHKPGSCQKLTRWPSKQEDDKEA